MDAPAVPGPPCPQTALSPASALLDGSPPGLPLPFTRDYCPHREWNPGRRSFGPDVPPSAQGEFFPGDEPGPRCDLSGDECDPHPCHCPLWKPSPFICPACLELEVRRWPESVFRQSFLLAVPDEHGEIPAAARCRPHRMSAPIFHCPACDDEYASLPALLLTTLDRLRDTIDDCDHYKSLAEVLTKQLEETQ